MASSSVLVLYDGVPVRARTATTSRGLVQEHKGGPIPLGEVSREVPEDFENQSISSITRSHRRASDETTAKKRLRAGRKSWEEERCGPEKWFDCC